MNSQTSKISNLELLLCGLTPKVALTQAVTATKWVHVRAYRRKNGTLVAAHYRTAPVRA